jgi:hypothetical protein
MFPAARKKAVPLNPVVLPVVLPMAVNKPLAVLGVTRRIA